MGALDLEQAAAELYAAPREAFVPLRKQLAKQARREGDRGLAEQIEKLAKPTTAAWLANGLVRADADAVRELVDLGDRMRGATERMDGQELRALSQRRPQLIRGLVRRASAGGPLSDAVIRELEEILTVAIADADTGRALLAGRLTSAREAAPLGAWPDVLPGAIPRAVPDADPAVAKDTQQRRAPRSDADPPAPAADSPRRSKQAERERREIQQKLERARAAVKDAEADRSQQEQALHDVAAKLAAASAEVLRLTEELAAAETREREARQNLVAAKARVKDAERRASQAWREVQLAERRLSRGSDVSDR